jgi:LmbE family N-acetylglucosaminyl deacetylase
MAHHGILECYRRSDTWLLGVTVTDGSGSPRAGRFADHTDEQMRVVRNEEEMRAADIGEYSAVVLLNFPSASARDAGDEAIVADLTALLRLAQPQVVYTHNLADKHDTHVAVGLRTLEALRRLPAGDRPEAVYGCEVWRDLDWMVDDDTVLFDVGAQGALTTALIGAYESQIAGGKRYDLATAGRRLANATFSESREVDAASAVIYAMDLLPLVEDPGLDPGTYVSQHIERVGREISDRIARLSTGAH